MRNFSFLRGRTAGNAALSKRDYTGCFFLFLDVFDAASCLLYWAKSQCVNDILTNFLLAVEHRFNHHRFNHNIDLITYYGRSVPYLCNAFLHRFNHFFARSLAMWLNRCSTVYHLSDYLNAVLCTNFLPLLLLQFQYHLWQNQHHQ